MIPYGKHYIDEDDVIAVADVLRGGWLTQGPKIEEFEKAIASYVGAKYAVAVNSGTSALHLSALVAGVGKDVSLVTSPITFVATANAGLYVGGEVFFADIDAETINISPDQLQNVVSQNPNIKAIYPVHFAGLPCDMDAIKNVADNAGAVVVEDAAHALGASYPDGSKVGCCSNSLMTIFSLHPVKAIAAGEGGVITTNDEEVYLKLLRLRSHGINKGDDALLYPKQHDDDGIQAQWYYEMQEIGYNYRITDIQCALALSQLSKLDKFIERRSELVKRYDKAFLDAPDIRPAQNVNRDGSAHHLYPLMVDFNNIGISRQKFIKSLLEKGIGTQVHYIPVTMQPVYRNLNPSVNDNPNAFNYYEQAISIPLYYSLKNDEQDFVIESILSFLG